MNDSSCKNCKQGYTKIGNASYPDHIELCPLHATTPDLLAAAVEINNTAIFLANTAPGSMGKAWAEVSRVLSPAILKAEGR